MKGYILEYENENEFLKLERALKKYNMLAYKKLNCDYYPKLRSGEFLGEVVKTNKKDEIGEIIDSSYVIELNLATYHYQQDEIVKYELKLPSDHMFSQVHGDIKLHYTVYKKDKCIVLNTITPSDILLEGHKPELTMYKGVQISKQDKEKAMYKIDLLKMLNK